MIKLNKEYLKDMLNGDLPEEDNSCIIKETLVGHDRWSLRYEIVFKHKDKHYRTYYNVGATEMQPEGPFEYAKDEIYCEEVRHMLVPTWT